MKFVFLSDLFYRDYANCAEIEKKPNRPYVQVCVEVNGILFGIPMRSHIRHPHVLWTDREAGCGLDFSKTVVIVKDEYINHETQPYIRQVEFEALRGKENAIRQKLLKYLYEYQKAKSRPDIPRNRRLCQYSALQYFEEYIFRNCTKEPRP